MRRDRLTQRISPLAAAAVLLAPVASAQIGDHIRGEASEANHFIATPRGWRHPMTPWGDPDIRATLDMMQASRVPLERCADSYRPDAAPCDVNLKWWPEAEHNARMEAYQAARAAEIQLLAEGDLAVAMRTGTTTNRIPQRQTNLLVDPPNGLLPPLTPQGKRLAQEMGSDWALPGEDLVFESVEDFDSWDRCITRGMPSMMMPYRYNGGFRIRQTPGYVVFDIEMIHEARVIPIDGRPPLDPAVKQWLGDSRGHWEGTTLVVETTNYGNGMEINNPLINLGVQGSPPGNRFPQSDKLKTIERITRLNDDTWLYEITAIDPEVMSAPFTVRYPMRNDPSYWWSEYACHEDNTIVRNYVETDRYRRANPEAEPPQPPVAVPAAIADALAGRWVGRPRIVTIDVDIELQFTKNADGTVNAKLIGTTLGPIDKPLQSFTIDGRTVAFVFPNVDPWNASLTLRDDGTLQGGIWNIQGTMPVTFRRVAD